MSSHTTPGPAAKRRRVELANATLRRPFRSPMIKNRSPSGDINSTPTATRLGEKPTRPREAMGGGGGGAADVTERGEKEKDDDDNDAETSFETSFSSVTTTPAASKASKSSLHYGGSTGLRSTSTRRNAKPASLDFLNNEKDDVPEFRKAARSGITRKRSSLGLGSTTTVTSIIPTKRPSLGQSYTTKARTIVGEAGSDSDGDDDILAKLQKSHRVTRVHLVAMQKELDLIRQAKQIEMASRKKPVEEESKERLRRHDDATATVIDAELRELVQKWKLASRQAADDLFGLIKGRVADMGGAKAWKETRRRQIEGFHSAWDEKDQRKGKKRKGDNNEREIADSDAASDDEGFANDDGGLLSHEAGNGDGEKIAEDDCEDSGFTMLMMLQSLNIGPDVLGYDPNEDKWLD